MLDEKNFKGKAKFWIKHRNMKTNLKIWVNSIIYSLEVL